MKTNPILTVLRVVLGLCLLGLGSAAWTVEAYEAMQQQRAVIEAKRQIIMTQNLELRSEERDKFWSLYRDYRREAADLDDRLMNLIKRYADGFASLSDDHAEDLMEELFSLQEDILKQRKKYVRKLRRFLPDVKVARFYQIENRLDAIRNYQMAQQIPMIPVAGSSARRAPAATN